MSEIREPVRRGARSPLPRDRRPRWATSGAAGANGPPLDDDRPLDGREADHALIYIQDGARYVIVPPRRAAPRSIPAGTRTCAKTPEVGLQIKDEVLPGPRPHRPRRGSARSLFAQGDGDLADFDEYVKRTTREIPVVVLERAGTTDEAADPRIGGALGEAVRARDLDGILAHHSSTSGCSMSRRRWPRRESTPIGRPGPVLFLVRRSVSSISSKWEITAGYRCGVRRRPDAMLRNGEER